MTTAWEFVTSPIESAREVKGGSVGWAWVFAVLCLSFQLAAWVLVAALTKAPPQERLAQPAVAAVVALGWLLVLPLGEFVTLRAMGIEAPLATHLRTSAYSSAAFLVPWCACVGLGLWAPWLRLVTLRSAFGLSWPQALLAVTALPLTCACVIIATRADLSWWL